MLRTPLVLSPTSGRSIVSDTEGKYSVELFKECGEGAGLQEILDNLDKTRQLDRSPCDLSRPRFAISGPAGHVVRPRSHFGEQ